MAKPRSPDPKIQALRETGTVNPHPQAVADELFRTHEFFDPRDLLQVKYEMLRRVQVEGQSVTQAATAFGFSRLTFYQARAAFGRDGMAGLLPRKRGPRHPHKLTEAVLAFLEQARAAEPSGRVMLLSQLVHQRFGIRVHPRSIERVLARRGKKRR
jgi:transposase